MTQDIRRGLIPCLPEAGLDDHLAVIEVLIQEGFHFLGVSASDESLAELVRIFGHRADFWAIRVASAEDVAKVASTGVVRMLADDSADSLVEAAQAAGADLWVSAMTSTEVRAVLASPVAGALLWPADVVGHTFAARLAEVGLASSVIPMGGVGAYAAGEWLKAGSPVVCVDSALLGDAYEGGSLSKLRERCASFISVQGRYL